MTLAGATFSPVWGIPFAGMLLSIALMPLCAPRFWHAHFGKISAFWGLAFLLPLAAMEGATAAVEAAAHTMLAEYIPFVVLLAALFTAAGGIHIRGNWHGSPFTNVLFLLLGALLASVMGTTGACMLLIHPLLRANDNRPRAAHVVVFFIFIVGNVGGALTPLGDPPLFLGFLQGVSFFWTLQALWQPTAALVLALLAIFYGIDVWYFRRDGLMAVDPTPDTAGHPGLGSASGFGVDGAINFLPLAAVVGLVLLSGVWKPGVQWEWMGTSIPLQQVLRDGLLVCVILVSLWITPPGVRERNQFSWAPMLEVAKLFAGIFITMVPVLAMLKAGEAGAFATLAHAVAGADGQPQAWAYFWLTGALSSFLDNAPTYLVFFNLAGGDAQALMGPLSGTLAAISAGAVFMGANSYIGNAPNFMVKAVAESKGVRMPGFFGYMVWSGVVLLPLFGLMTIFWFK